MGRIFEVRKAKMFARYDRMAKQFTRFGKEIAIAVKAAGPNPDYNPRLRTAIQNAKAINMPKDRIEAAINRAVDKSQDNYEEVNFEGYGPHGVAIFIEAATDNNTRTVANVRMHFNRCNGSLGKTGSLEFLFDHKGIFKINDEELDLEEVELDLIDHGLEEIAMIDGETALLTQFQDFGDMAKTLEEKGIEVKSSELQRFPKNYVDLPEEQAKEVLDLIDRLEGDEDVQQVFHNLK